MKILTSILILYFSSSMAFAQGSDMILLKKKNNRTVKKYLAETQIHLITKNGERIKGMIKKIDRDSMFVNIYDERPAYTMWGTKFWDTVSIALMKVHHNEVAQIVKPRVGLGIIRNGYLLMASGLSYAILHLSNAAISKYPVEGGALAKAGGLILGGLVLRKTNRNTVTIGERFKLQYIPLK